MEDIIHWDILPTCVSRADVHTFRERMIRARRMRTAEERNFWTKADPTLDAWMLVFGQKREVFDVDALVARHPNIYNHLQRARKAANVRVMQDSCPVFESRKRKLLEEQGKEEEEEERPQVPSTSYWTTIKKWRPW